MGREGVTREGKSSAFVQYGRLIADLYREGHSLRSIGCRINRTGEAVRLILNKHYPNIVVSVITEAKLARLIGVLPDKLERLRRKGILHPEILREGFYLYDAEGVLEARLACQKFCGLCNELISLRGNNKYCSDCAEKARKNPWFIRTPESKRKCTEANRSWKLRNPEKAKTMEVKANRKYLERQKAKHFAETEYIVIRKNDTLPIGTVFKAIGGNGHWSLKLEDGTTIPIVCVGIVGEKVECNAT